MTAEAEKVRVASRQILRDWLTSCTRRGTISRNTIAGGIVVLDHLRRQCPVTKSDVISEAGELKGARSGLKNILETYQVPTTYLKEATTRQVHQDGQRLFERLDWGRKLAGLSAQERDQLLLELIETLASQARDWVKRQNLAVDVDPNQTPAIWVRMIMEKAKQHSGGVVEQHLVGAKLSRRFKNVTVPNFPAHAADRQTGRTGDFALSNFIYHVTATPSRGVMQKCADNLKAGFHPILLVPSKQEERARELANEAGISKLLTIVSLEEFVSVNIIEMAIEENKGFFGVLKEIIEIYNKRLAEVETDLSLQIEVR